MEAILEQWEKTGHKKVGPIRVDKDELFIQLNDHYAEELGSKEVSILWDFFLFVRKIYPEAVMTIIKDPASFDRNKTKQGESVYINLGDSILGQLKENYYRLS